MMIHAERAIQGILDLQAKMPWSLQSEQNDEQESDVKRYLTPEKISHLVTAEFENIRKKPKDDLWDEIGREEFKSKVKGLVDNGKTIGFVLPAFPFKSANHVAKVMGPMPDVGERIAIRRLHKFAATVSCFFKPGAVVVIVSDGRVFADLVDVGPEDVKAYQEAVKTWFPSPYVRFVSLADIFTDSSDDLKRDRLMSLYGGSLQDIDHSIKEDKDNCMLYCGFKRFLLEDKLHVSEMSTRQKSKDAAARARHVLLRNEAYSSLVNDLFSKHVRLSIHPHDNTKKFGINLVGGSLWGTPWHNVLVQDKEQNYKLMKRYLAENAGYTLTYDDMG